MKSLVLNVLSALALCALATGCRAKPLPDPVPPVPATVKSFTVSKNVVTPGEKVTLNWEVTDASSVSLATSGGEAIALADPSAASGSIEIAVDADTTYVLTAHGAGGADQAITAVAVQREPTDLFLSVSPPEVTAGEPVAIVWKAAGAGAIAITDADGASVYSGDERSGSLVVYPAKTTTFTLAQGDRTVAGSVSVAPAIVAFGADVPSAQAGQTVTLSWKAAGATEVTLEALGRGVLTTETDAAKIADGSFADTIPAITADRNGVVEYRLTAKNGAQVVTRDFTLYVGVDPDISLFDVPAFAKDGGQYVVSWKTLEATHVVISIDDVPVYDVPTAAEIASGSRFFPTPTADVTLTLTATNDRGGKATVTKTVSPVGAVLPGTFTTSTAVLANGGDPATLTWNIPNARHVRIEAKNGPVILELTGKNAESGTVDAYPNHLTEYVLSADNTVGDILSTQPSVTVDVTQPARLQFNPPFAQTGATVALTGSTVMGAGAVENHTAVVVADPAESFVDISTTGISTNYVGPDTSVKVLTLPETFDTTVMGTKVSSNQVSISINGWFVFGSHYNYTDTAVPFPTSALEPLAIAPYFEDLYDTASSEIYYQLDTVGTDRRLIIQWNKVEYDPNNGSQLTFEAQVYSSGKIVFAYGPMTGATGAKPSVGVIDETETDAVVAPTTPAPGDVYRLFGPITLPAQVLATPRPMEVRISVGTGFIDVADTPVNKLSLSEVNPTPPTGVTDGQWLELHNGTSDPVDLSGWTLDFGGGSTHTIAANTIVPANAYFVLGQSQGAGDGVNVDYVYGNTFTLPSNGAVTLLASGVPVSSIAATGTLPAGTAWQQGTLPTGLTLAPGISALSCGASSKATYGTHGQHGTPGAANGTCPGYTYTGAITSNFEPIATTGTKVTFAVSQDDDVSTITLPTPVVVDGVAYSSIQVGTNGFLSLVPVSCGFTGCRANETTVGAPTPPTGLVAPYWDDLQIPSTGGVYWERKVPGITPNDGYTIVSWEHVIYFLQTSQDLNFQVKFFDDGSVEFHYGTFVGENGSRATTWLEFPDGKSAFIVNVNSTTPGIAANTAYRFSAN